MSPETVFEISGIPASSYALYRHVLKPPVLDLYTNKVVSGQKEAFSNGADVLSSKLIA